MAHNHKNLYYNHGSNSHNSRNSGRKLSAYEIEDRFCRTVGGVSWKKVKEEQRYIYLDKKVMEWKDSAVEEAFSDAKKRFLAKLHRRPCDINLPDPDVFMARINWDPTSIDPKLLSDLENEAVDSSCETEKQDGGATGVIIGLPAPADMITYDLTPTGWGDAENVKPPEDARGNEDWADSGVKKEEKYFSNGWEDATQNVNHDGGNTVSVSTRNGPGKQQSYGNGKRCKNGRNYPYGHGFGRKGEPGGCSTSRFSQSQRNGYDRSFDNSGRGK